VAVTLKLLVTGASGFLGSVLTRHLAAADHKVVALTRTLPPQGDEGRARVAWVQGDLGSPHDAAECIEGVDAVVHLAWTNTPLTSNAHLPSDANANILPTLTLLEAVREGGTRPHIVFASSGGTVYGPARDGHPFREGDACQPHSSYAIQKLAVEHYLRMASEHGWLTATVLRMGNAYGVLLPPERMQGFIGTAVSQLRAGSAIRVFGSPKNVRDYVHVDDVCRAVARAILPTDAFDVFNIGSGTGHSVEDVVHLIEELEGHEVGVRYEHPADADELPGWVVLDTGKARDRLGWSAEVTLRAGLDRLLASSRDPLLGRSPKVPRS
jgi:UDP-glucose 4-epimerase